MVRCRCWLSLLLCLPAAAAELPLERIKLPPGFRVEVYATGVKNAREMVLSPSGTLFVSTRREGNVYALQDTKHQNKADRVVTIAKGLENPNGVAFRDGALYVMERSRLSRYDDIERQLDHPPKPVVLRDDFPTEAHHGWKFIAFGPDGWLYVPVGAPCNICKSGPIYATITRVSPDGKQREIYAHGVRNTVGFDWHPQTKELWFTDNGRDEMGDDVPPDELDHAPRAGMHFGFPYCHAGVILDPEFNDRSCTEFEPPVQRLGPHAAALGMRFYTGSMFPPEYKNAIILAEHGSWNREHKLGYRVMVVRLDDNKAVSYEPLVTGWLDDATDQVWGRPVDVEVLDDGSLLISDDWKGVLYRVTYKK